MHPFSSWCFFLKKRGPHRTVVLEVYLKLTVRSLKHITNGGDQILHIYHYVDTRLTTFSPLSYRDLPLSLSLSLALARRDTLIFAPKPPLLFDPRSGPDLLLSGAKPLGLVWFSLIWSLDAAGLSLSSQFTSDLLGLRDLVIFLVDLRFITRDLERFVIKEYLVANRYCRWW